MRRSRVWILAAVGLWCLPLWAEVKVIPVFETQAAVQTLKDLYPELGVSAMGNQLVLSGSAAQLQEAEAALAKFNQPPQSLLIEWRVDGASSSQQAGVGLGRDAKRQWLLEGNAQQYQRSQNDSWQVRGLSGRPVLLQMGTYQPVTFISGVGAGGGADAAGERPLCHRHPDWRQGTDSAQQRAGQVEQGTINRGQSATEVSGAPVSG
jgi:hypothetical protein